MKQMANTRWPDFFIVGAPKAGTTLLHECLCVHPDVFMPELKEPRYFVRAPDGSSKRTALAVQSEAEYLALFAKAEANQLIGEASPQYLARPLALERIVRQCPGARIIILLREPVSRAWSNYLMHHERAGKHRNGFPEVVRREMDAKLRGEKPPTGYVTTGEYGRWVVEWFERFGRDNVGVFLFDDLKRDIQAFSEQAVDFLGLDVAKLPPVSGGVRRNEYVAARSRVASKLAGNRVLKRGWRKLKGIGMAPNPAGIKRVLYKSQPKPEIDPETASLLAAHYRDDIARLEAVLGEELPSLYYE